jgi:F-type H+-transporting ATPase subunit alpha
MKVFEQYIKELEQEISSHTKRQVKSEEIGYVEEVRDGVAVISGLNDVAYGEIVTFESGIKGSVIDMLEEMVGVIVLGDYLQINSGEVVKATGDILSIPVGDEVLGRVVNPLAEPQDSDKSIKSTKRYPIEKIAPKCSLLNESSQKLKELPVPRSPNSSRERRTKKRHRDTSHPSTEDHRLKA